MNIQLKWQVRPWTTNFLVNKQVEKAQWSIILGRYLSLVGSAKQARLDWNWSQIHGSLVRMRVGGLTILERKGWFVIKHDKPQNKGVVRIGNKECSYSRWTLTLFCFYSQQLLKKDKVFFHHWKPQEMLYILLKCDIYQTHLMELLQCDHDARMIERNRQLSTKPEVVIRATFIPVPTGKGASSDPKQKQLRHWLLFSLSNNFSSAATICCWNHV